jgi:hypothetical protein
MNVTVQVQVQAAIDAAKSTFTIEGITNTIWANNVDSRILHFTPRDASGAVVTGLNPSDIVFDYGFGNKASSFTKSSITRKADGSFTQMVKGTLDTGGMHISVSVKNKITNSELSNDHPVIVMMGPNEANTTLSLISTKKISDVKRLLKIEIHVKDDGGADIPYIEPGEFNVWQNDAGGTFYCSGLPSFPLPTAGGGYRGYSSTDVECTRSNRNPLEKRTITFNVGIKGYSWSKSASLKY